MAAQRYLDYGPKTPDEEARHTGYALRVVPQGYVPIGHRAGPSSRLEAQALGIVDRADDLAAIRSLLLADEVRLLTLTGPAGVGKTRLALEAGRTVALHFDDGVVFVDLSSVWDPNVVFEVLAQSLDADDVPADGNLPVRLEQALRDRAMLIVLDNVEQVLPGALHVAELLVTAPRVKLLVTSREALHLRWERIFPVPPLTLPDPQHLAPLEELEHIPSVELFLQRAQAINPAFALTEDNARAVAELVVHLDGLPLAIELAAARSTLLSPQMIVERLGQRLSLLRWRAQDLPSRQQTLRSAIAWSYDFLSVEEQTLFRRLGIFAGSFSLDAAEAIAEPLVDPIEGLASLVDKSLVQVYGGDQDHVRYVLLESIRAYARERLAEAGELEEAGRIHAWYYLGLAESAEPELTGPDQQLWLGRLEWALENMRAALRWFLDHDEGEVALRLATALGSFWEARCCVAEGRRQLEEALARTSTIDPHLRAKGLSWLGALLTWTAGEAEDANRSMEVERAKAVLGEAVTLARSVEDPLTLARSLTSLGLLCLQTQEWSQAKRWLEEAKACWQEAHHLRGVASTLVGLGVVALLQGNHQEAARLAEESAVRSRGRDDDSSTDVALLVVLSATGARGERARTTALVHQLLESSHQGQHPHRLALCAAGVAWLCRERGDPARLARLVGATETRHPVTDYTGRVLFRLVVAAATETLQARLGPEAFATAFAEGRSLSLEQMTALIGEALDDPRRSGASTESAPKPGPANILSPREHDVLQLVTQGLSDKQIAQELIVSKSTVHYHMTSIFNKLGVDSRAHAVAVAAQRRLVLLDQA